MLGQSTKKSSSEHLHVTRTINSADLRHCLAIEPVSECSETPSTDAMLKPPQASPSHPQAAAANPSQPQPVPASARHYQPMPASRSQLEMARKAKHNQPRATNSASSTILA